jgi:hypothetical protein
MELKTIHGVVTISDDELIYDDKIRILVQTVTDQQEMMEKQACELTKLRKPVDTTTKIIGILSTVFILIGSPTVALFVSSIVGWVIYSVSAILGMIYTKRRCDYPIFVQFVWYLGWNMVAIWTRL